MNHSGNPSKRNKNRSMPINSNAASMSSNLQRPMPRNSTRNIHSNSINMRSNDLSGNSSLSSNQRNFTKPIPDANSNENSNNNLNNEVCNGVYKNKRLMHSMTSLIGCLVEVQLEDGKRYEGILKTFSSEFELALYSASLVVDDPSEKRQSVGHSLGNLLTALERNEELIDTLVIDPRKMVNFKVLNVDLDFATKKSIMTDSEISKHDGSKQYRELVPWESDDVDSAECLETLEGSTNLSNGWKSEDMFKLNESKYKIATTYDDEMSEYTIKLEPRNDEEYRQREAQAAKIAREIEQDSARVARYAKEDELDEESLYSAVIRDPEDSTTTSSSPNTSTSGPKSNYGQNYRAEVNHQRDDRRDNMRNTNQDNMGFRTQNSRQNRNRIPNRSGANESNWRENTRNSSSRYHQSATIPSYNNNNKFSNSSGTGNNVIHGYGGNGPSNKYVNHSNQYSNATSQAKSSYSAVSARNVPIETNVGSIDCTENVKTYANRTGNHAKDYSNNDDHYPRKTGHSSGGSNQRSSQNESFKSQSQRTPYSRIVEQSHSDSEEIHTPSQTQTCINSPKNSAAEIKPESPDTESNKKLNNSKSSTSSPNLSKEASNIDSDKKSEIYPSKVSSPTSSFNDNNIFLPSASTISPNSSLASNTTSSNSSTTNSSTIVPVINSESENFTRNSPPISSPNANNTSSNIDVVTNSKLNPNAKAFTPRGSSALMQSQQTPIVISSYYQNTAGHLSTTPPSIPSTPLGPATAGGQFIQYTHPGGAPHISTHPNHHHQQQQLRYANNSLQFPAYNPLLPPLNLQYIAIPHFPSSMTAQTPSLASQSSSSPNVAGQPGPPPTLPSQSAPIPSHQMISNTSVANQPGSQSNVVASQQAPPPPPLSQPNSVQPTRSHYRSSSKGSTSANPQSQQLLRPAPQQLPHHEYSQQTQVVDVTGQPIMTGAAHGHQHLSVVFPQSAAVHHNQNQIHGQQPQNIAQLATQPNQTQPIPHYMCSGFPRPIIQSYHTNTLNIAALTSGLYPDSHMQVYCTEMPPPMMAAQSMAQMPHGQIPPQPQTVSSNGLPPSVPPIPSSQSPTQCTVPTATNILNTQS
ncbi:COP9 signalosome [Sarcoptes scabiei]|uniref:Ataxin-2-like protein n=1 Tax=Sarcoptes scabiei TaxID=52283 RepID=A0A132A2R4_SARSC|nr:ataxin-2-like protein [Sarcoptes scabiei]UXI14969.1 COP9 signalosome [Sarcoptes scabiei]